MKLRFFSLLLVGLMAMSTFAATIDQWQQTTPPSIGNWTDPNMWKLSVAPVPTTVTADEYKMNAYGGQATINTTVGSGTNYNRLTVAAGGNDLDVMKLVIATGANATFSEIRIGHGNSSDKGKWGKATQTGGTLTLDKLQLGYYGTRTVPAIPSAKGTYTISGGTLQAKAGSTGRLMVGTGITTGATSANNEGVFTVVGDGGTISMTELYVGGYSTYVGTGTLAFEVAAGGVSKITVSSIINLDLGGASSVANLNVTNPGGFLGTIVLVENTGTTSAVVGLFDSLNGGSAAEGASVTIAGGVYTLTYMYDAVSKTVGSARSTTYNDIALIPEPATIALLTLGLIAIRRKK